jgi:hypothetical protein
MLVLLVGMRRYRYFSHLQRLCSMAIIRGEPEEREADPKVKREQHKNNEQRQKLAAREANNFEFVDPLEKIIMRSPRRFVLAC